jgi:hemin uptake protein HemP
MSTAPNFFENTKAVCTPRQGQNCNAGSSKPRGSLNSSDILQGQTAVEINHNGATYRLQATRLGKLILTK